MLNSKGIYGIIESDWEEILKSFFRYKEIEKVVIFGSRAKGTYKIGSDIDLALYGKRITLEIVSSIQGFLNEETLLPFTFDLIHYETITNPAVKEHIDHWGKEIYRRQGKTQTAILN